MWEASSLSRAITYPNGSRCWPQVPGAWPRQGSGDNCFHPSLLRGVGGSRGDEFENFAAQLAGSGDPLLGHRTFWLSNYAVHRERVAGGKSWVSSVKGFDHDLLNGECVNDAGIQSYFLSWGTRNAGLLDLTCCRAASVMMAGAQAHRSTTCRAGST